MKVNSVSFLCFVDQCKKEIGLSPRSLLITTALLAVVCGLCGN